MKNTYHSRAGRFVRDIVVHTPFIQMVILLIVLWLIFSLGIYLSENGKTGTSLHTYSDALYWGIAAFSTAGIADTPVTGSAKLIGGLWIIIGSVLFFGAIVATVTSYFMRPMQRPHKRIIDTIEYNLEQLDDLSHEELDLLRDTINTLIEHVEELREVKENQQNQKKPDV